MPDILPAQEMLIQIQNFLKTNEDPLAKMQAYMSTQHPRVKVSAKQLEEIVRLSQGKYTPGSLLAELKKTPALKVSEHGFDEKVYSQILAFTTLASIVEKDNDAKLHAYKLAVLFGGLKPALDYLREYHKENKNLSTNLVQKACFFELPKGDNWDVVSWRQLAQAYMKDSSFRKTGVVAKATEIQAELLKNKRFTLRSEESPIRRDMLEKETELSQLRAKSKELEAQRIKYEKQKRNGLSQEEEQILQQLKSEITALNKNIQKVQHDIAKLQTKLPVLLQKAPLATLKSTALNLKYARAKEDEEAALLFNNYNVPAEDFNTYLDLKKTAKNSDKLLPPIIIEGQTFGMEDCYIVKLDKDDPKGPLLGHITACCQSLNGVGRQAAVHGIESEDGGFYVICKGKLPKDEKGRINTKLISPKDIMAQCWAWRGSDGSIVLDSIESQPNIRSVPENLRKISVMATALAYEFTQKHQVPFVNVGTSGETLESIGYQNTNASQPITPSGYSDAKRQRVVANSQLPLYAKAYFDPLGTLREYYALPAEKQEAYDIRTFAKIATVNSTEEKFDAFLKELSQHDIDTQAFLNQSPFLVYAMQAGNIRIISYLLQKKVDINQQDENKITPLLSATNRFNLPMVRLLLENGADVFGKDERGLSPLTLIMLLASKEEIPDENHRALINLLVANGADITLKVEGLDAGQNVDPRYPNSPVKHWLREAAVARDIAKNTFNNQAFGSVAFRTPQVLLTEFQSRIATEERDSAKKWISAWVKKVTTENKTLDKLTDEENPLQFAVAYGFVDLAEALLKQGAKVNQPDLLKVALNKDIGNRDMALLLLKYGKTIDINLAQNADAEIQELLLNNWIKEIDNKEIDINSSKDPAIKWTALMWAVKLNKPEVVEKLIRNGADIYAQNARGNTAIDIAGAMAAKEGDFKILQLLLNAQNTTLLIWAINDEKTILIEKILETDINVNETDGQGLPPLYYAIVTYDTDIVPTLLEKGANINWQHPETGQTPLMLAIADNNVVMAKAILAGNPDLRLQNKKGETAENLAKGKNPQIQKLIQDYAENIEQKEKNKRAKPLLFGERAPTLSDIKEEKAVQVDVDYKKPKPQ